MDYRFTTHICNGGLQGHGGNTFMIVWVTEEIKFSFFF